MITKKRTEVFTCPDGTEHKTIQEARAHELAKLWSGDDSNSPREMRGDTFAAWAEANAAALIAILKASTRKPRVPKTPKPKAPAQPKGAKP